MGRGRTGRRRRLSGSRASRSVIASPSALGEHPARANIDVDEHTVRELTAQGAYGRSPVRVHTRRLDAVHGIAPVAWKTASNEAVEFGGRSRGSEALEPRAEVQGEVAGVLERPPAGGASGAPLSASGGCSMNTSTYSRPSRTGSARGSQRRGSRRPERTGTAPGRPLRRGAGSIARSSQDLVEGRRRAGRAWSARRGSVCIPRADFSATR